MSSENVNRGLAGLRLSAVCFRLETLYRSAYSDWRAGRYLLFERAQLLETFRTDHPELRKVDDDKLFAAISEV